MSQRHKHVWVWIKHPDYTGWAASLETVYGTMSGGKNPTKTITCPSCKEVIHRDKEGYFPFYRNGRENSQNSDFGVAQYKNDFVGIWIFKHTCGYSLTFLDDSVKYDVFDVIVGRKK